MTVFRRLIDYTPQPPESASGTLLGPAENAVDKRRPRTFSDGNPDRGLYRRPVVTDVAYSSSVIVLLLLSSGLFYIYTRVISVIRRRVLHNIGTMRWNFTHSRIRVYTRWFGESGHTFFFPLIGNEFIQIPNYGIFNYCGRHLIRPAWFQNLHVFVLLPTWFLVSHWKTIRYKFLFLKRGPPHHFFFALNHLVNNFCLKNSKFQWVYSRLLKF